MTLNNHRSPTASVNKLTVWTRRPITTGGCISGDAVLVQASSGWPIALRDLVRRRDGAVLTMREASVFTLQHPAAYLAHEAAELYRLTTYTGRSIETTAEHPFLTRDGWKPVSALCPTDTVAVVTEYPQLFGRGDTDAELVKLLAYLTANGTNGDGAAPPITDPDVRADFEAAVQVKQDECVALEDDTDRTRLYVRGPAGTHSKILRYMDIVGVHGVQARDKFVPDFMFGLRQDKLRLYLNRLFTCDGVVETSGRITYRTMSVRMARQVQHLLARFGVVSLLRGIGSDDDFSVELLITTKTDVLRFIEDIGFFGDKAARAEEVRASLYHIRMIEPPPDRLGPILFDRVYMVERTESAPVYDLAIPETHNFVANDFVVRTSSWSSLVASGCLQLMEGTPDVEPSGGLARESAWRPSDTRPDELDGSR
jgi:replicative DNA helicase